jgi:FKBP-type peptidyl-prolyl cis-trans isomerase 2
MRREERSAVDSFSALVVVLIMIAGVMGVLLYSHMTKEPHTSPIIVRVEEGDEIEFTYTGYMTNSLVFETMLEEVAIDNDTYPKSLLWEWPEGGVFGAIPVTVGDGIPHYTFQGMSGGGEALMDAMIGMTANETKTVWVSPENGFGEPDPTKRVTLSLEEVRAVKEVMTVGEFGMRFDAMAIVNATYTDPRWGWTVRVISSREGPIEPEVTIYNDATEGMVVSPYLGFESEVISVESGANEGWGEIKLRHLLTPDDVNKVMGDSPDDDGRFVVIGVNEAAKTFEADFNSEKAGVLLRYDITITSIVRR